LWSDFDGALCILVWVPLFERAVRRRAHARACQRFSSPGGETSGATLRFLVGVEWIDSLGLGRPLQLLYLSLRGGGIDCDNWQQ
jgi:hypothetical protein